MTHKEFEQWVEFFTAQPFDDLHRYQRPAALVAKSMGGGDIKGYLDWLIPPANRSSVFSDADLRTFETLGMKPPGT